jgi:hypothetical protein
MIWMATWSIDIFSHRASHTLPSPHLKPSSHTHSHILPHTPPPCMSPTCKDLLQDLRVSKDACDARTHHLHRLEPEPVLAVRSINVREREQHGAFHPHRVKSVKWINLIPGRPGQYCRSGRWKAPRLWRVPAQPGPAVSLGEQMRGEVRV